VTPEQTADAQRRLGLTPTGARDDELYSAVRNFQLQMGLLVTGFLDEATYQRLWSTQLLGPRAGNGGSAGPETDSDISTHTGD